jgi:hypothetical protein
MDYHAAGLVHDYQIVVLVCHIQRYILRTDVYHPWGGYVDLEYLTLRRAVIFSHGLTVHRNTAALDQLLNGTSRHAVQRTGEKRVYPLTALKTFNGKNHLFSSSTGLIAA